MSSSKDDPRLQQGQKLPHGKPLIPLDHGLGSSSSSTSTSKGPPDKQPPSAATGNGLPSVNVPRGGGAIRGTGERFSVSPATGSATASIPLPISQGRSGFAPELSLSYDSGAGNGPFGFGWQLGGLPSVGRKTDQGLPRYDDVGESDTFVITGAEDLVPMLEMRHDGTWCRPEPKRRCVDGLEYLVFGYRPRIEGSFSRIERWVHVSSGDTHWRSISRGNQTTVFGEDASSRIADPDDPCRVFQWLASRTYDDRGNAMVFEYKAEDSEGVDAYAPHETYRRPRHREATKYLKRIKYGNRLSRLVEEIHAGSEWMFELVFDFGDHDKEIPLPRESWTWSTRTDPFSSHRSGFELRTYRLCHRILMFHHFPGEIDVGDDTLVSSLGITYYNNGFERSIGLSSATCASSFQKISYLRKAGGGYVQQSLPPVELDYSEAVISGSTSYLSTSALEGIPLGLQGDNYQFLDLDGEGVPGILAHHAGSYYYKANLGNGDFAPPVALPHMPTLYTSNGRSAAQPQWLDLLGDGHMDMVRFDGSTPGFYKRAVPGGGGTPAEPDEWQPFKPFEMLPNLRWQDPNTKFIDLTGDGHADILITADEQVFTIYPSLREDGFGPPTHWRPPLDENKGPRLVFEDGTKVIYTADMSGDGLSDLVRIGYHEVCYWPNLGYGRFGHKVVMSNAPLFDCQDHFRQSRLRLADIDGSGTTDLVYLKGHETMVYLNQAGNGWTRGHPVTAFPATDDTTTNVQVVDLLARGTGCLVWSSNAGSDLGMHVRYVDLMERGKPYLMARTRNNLGSETRYSYASSSKFYLADKAAGDPWVTKLPFPVHVVERMDNFDRVSKNRFTTRYGYHSGYYDGLEKEFRGFGMVETWDTENISALRESRRDDEEDDGGAAAWHGYYADSSNWDSTSTVPPVLTKTWFHTGVCFLDEKCTLEAAFSRQYHPIDLGRRIPSSAAVPAAVRIRGNTYIPYSLPHLDRREAFRALKGSVLHSEIYSLDGTPQAELPYTVNQANFLVELLQPGRSAGNPHAVFHMRGLESVQATYDRQLYAVSLQGGGGRVVVEEVPDPRTAHSLTLEADEWGNVLRAVALSYGRQFRDASLLLSEGDHEVQRRDYAVLTENTMTNAVIDEDTWLSPLSAESKMYELFNVLLNEDEEDGGGCGCAAASSSSAARVERPRPRRLISLERLRSMLSDLDSGAFDLTFEEYAGPVRTDNRPHRRLVQHAQSIYRSNDLSTPLPMGTVESLAIPFQNRQLAMSQHQVQDVFVADGKLAAEEVDHVLTQAGGYIRGEDGNWWAATARMFLSPDRRHTSAEELEYARAHFYLSNRAEDVFSTPERPIDSIVLFDKYDLLVQEAIDPLGNRTVVGELERDDAEQGVCEDRAPWEPSRLRRSGQNYRLLQPGLVTDPNLNRSEAAYDVMGMLSGSAVMGKPGEGEGDSLEDFVADVAEQTLQDFFEAPLENLSPLLGKATSRVLYDYHAFFKTRDDPNPQPVWSAALSREKHVSQLGKGEESRITLDVSYSDGFGRVIQHKVRAEPGPVPPGGTMLELGGDDSGSDTASGLSWSSSGGSSDTESTTSTTPSETSRCETRWISSGWTVYNNKGSPVRQFEPFFTSTHRYQGSAAAGVSPILLYDPIGRVVATLSPNHTWTKVRQDPWRAESWDANDTVLVPDPAEDPDVGAYFQRLPRYEYFPTWYTPRIRGGMGKEAEKAAQRAAAHADTPRTILADAMGRTFVAFETVRTGFTDSNGDAPTTQVWRNDAVLDMQGNQQRVHDSLGRLVGVASYSYGGGVLKQVGLENGTRWALTDVVGKTILSWDGRGHRLRMVYDELRRPTDVYLSQSGDGRRESEVLVEQMVYGESRVRPEETNARVRVVEVRDQAGVTLTEAYDFMGNILRTEHRLAKEYRETIDWAAEEGVALEEETYEQSLEYDALNRVTATTLSDGTVTRTKYSIRGLQESVSTWFRGETTETKVVLNTEYNARGQRTRSVFGNGTTTTNSYDPNTFRVIRITTRLKRRRCSSPGEADGAADHQLRKHSRHRRRRHHPSSSKGSSYERRCIQDLRHTYDAAGNLSSIVDRSQQTVWHRNTRVDASHDFIYDSTYRLIEAWGREHLGASKKAAGTASEEPKGSSGGQSARQDAHPGNGRAMGRYVERYHYDLASNMLRMEHRAAAAAGAAEGRNWTRHYGYEEPSALEGGVTNNRLSWTRIGRRTERYKYEGSQGANGAMTAMPKVPSMRWNFRDQLAVSSSQRQRLRGIDEPGYVDVADKLAQLDGGGEHSSEPSICNTISDSDSVCASSCESSGSGRGRHGLPFGRWPSRSPSRSSSRSSSGRGTETLTYYRYDYTGKRVRKVSESVRSCPAEAAEALGEERRARLKETIYVGGAFEIFRKYGLRHVHRREESGEAEEHGTQTPSQCLVGDIRLELQTCQILGAAGRSGSGNLPILRAEFMTVDSHHHRESHRRSSPSSKDSALDERPQIQPQAEDIPMSSSSNPSSSPSLSTPLLTPSSSVMEGRERNPPPPPPRLLRYQYSNLQGSSTLEVDENGRVLTREEYTPFGSTSYSAAGRAVGSHSLPPKRFRYAGAERDDATGLYCMGSRYYAASLGRWTSADPSGLADGLNSYVYAQCNPVAFTDPSGHSATTSSASTLKSSGKRHDEAMRQIARLLRDVNIRGKLEVVVKSGEGGSRLDWVRTGVAEWRRTSIELKTTNMWHYFEKAAKGQTRTVLQREKVAAAAAAYVRQVNRHSGHLNEFLNGIRKLAGVPSKREALIVVARGFDQASPQFKAFSDALMADLAAAKNGPVASAIINQKELKSAVKGGDLAARARVTQTVAGVVKESEAAAKAARAVSQGGFVSVDLAMFAGKGLLKGAKVLGAVGIAVSTASAVSTLADSGSTTAQKADAGLDLAANAMMVSGNPPVVAAGAGLSVGGAVGAWVDNKVEAAVTSAGGSHETAAVVGTGAGMLAGAATGAVMGATIGLALGPGGALAGAAIGGAAGAIGAALKISWGS